MSSHTIVSDFTPSTPGKNRLTNRKSIASTSEYIKESQDNQSISLSRGQDSNKALL
jgi:hypothetical protein